MGAIGTSTGAGALAQSVIGSNPLAASGAPAALHAVPSPSASGRDWALFDEETATPAILDAIHGAKRVINIEFFVMCDAGKGIAVTEALVAAARRGIEVNVITDLTAAVTPPFLSFQRFKRKLEAAGGHVKLTTRAFIPGNSNRALDHTDHRKVVTIDSSIAFTGGINYAKMEDDYHDSMIRLTGANAARLSAEQLDRWSRVNGGSITLAHQASVADAMQGASLALRRSDDMRLVVNAPEQERYEVSDAYMRLIQTAKTRLWIASPQYLDQKMLAEIDKAAQRGVDVRLVAPGTAPMGIVPMLWVHHSHFKKIIDHGGTVYEIPEVLHRKAIISDDTAIVGSFNITGRSRKHDHEIGVESNDKAFVAAIEQTLRKDSERGARLDSAKLKGFGQWMGDVLAQRLKFSY